MPALEPLRAEVQRAFGAGTLTSIRRVGAEAELIPVFSDTGAPVPIAGPAGAASLPLLQRLGVRGGWTEDRTATGAPLFHIPAVGVLSFEPGGQLELSSIPFASATTLVDSLQAAVALLRTAAGEEGIELLSCGIDPLNAVGALPMQLHSDRYQRMAEHLAGIGPAGAVMMRQTASLQINLDWGAQPLAAWQVLNAAAPYLVAIFANSRMYAGRDTLAPSFRSLTWREVDPLRTGLLGLERDAVGEYLEFAVRAPAMLHPHAGHARVSFADLLPEPSITREDWLTHLSTLFPEVRPKGYVEVRSLDAVEPEWYAVPIAVLAGIVYEARAQAAALELLGRPDPHLLRRAAADGLSDPSIGGRAGDLFEIALAGAERLGDDFLEPRHREVARAFFDRYTARGLAPADDQSLMSSLAPQRQPA